MADLEWFPVDPGRYLRNTLHLTARQHGAYWLLILAAFECKGRLPGSDAGLMAIGKLSEKDWRDDGPVLKAFLTRDGDVWVHEFALHIRADAETRVAAKRAAGKEGARKRWQGRADGKPIADPSISHGQTDAQSEKQLTNHSHGSITDEPGRASASPDGPPPARHPAIPDSSKWRERLDSFNPWLPFEDPRRGKWKPEWGLSPDSAGTNPSIPPLMLAAWRAKRDAAMKELAA